MNYAVKANCGISHFVAKFTNLAALIYANIYTANMYSFERGN